jgi:hypothetical protein
VAHISRAKGIELVLENDVSTDPPGRVIGDPHRLRQCLLNLLSNAVKFSRSGDRAAHIKVGWTTEKTEKTSMITISVTDNGIGIPKSKMNRLFHSFSQIDASITRQYGMCALRFTGHLLTSFSQVDPVLVSSRPFNRTRLTVSHPGLSITRGLARVLGGDCWAESAEGQGSTFYLMVKVENEATPIEAFKPGPSRRAVLVTAPTESSHVLARNLRQFNIETEIVEELNADQQPHPAPEFLVVDVESVASISDRLEGIKKWGKGAKVSDRVVVEMALTLPRSSTSLL